MNNRIIFKSRLLRTVLTVCCCTVLVLHLSNVFATENSEMNNGHSRIKRLEYGKGRRLQEDLKQSSEVNITFYAEADITYKPQLITTPPTSTPVHPVENGQQDQVKIEQHTKTPSHQDAAIPDHRKTVKRTKASSHLERIKVTQPKAIPQCDWSCTIKSFLHGKKKASYSSRVKVDSDSLPSNWTTAHTKMVEQRMQERKAHIKQVCHKHGLDKPSSSNQPNAWEFLINKKHNLVWCSIFKAASSTWFYNFNLLAGLTDHQQMQGSKMPMELARKIYPRPSVPELESMIDGSPAPTTFMISRHPLTRLVSVYRDKIVGSPVYYMKLSEKIIRRYPHLQKKENKSFWSQKHLPSFPAFVQYILDESAQGHKLDEHWAPMYTFCTPCLVDFNVYAKMETLEEDGNYIIFSTGIEKLIAPKKINLSSRKPTSTVTESYMCQLDNDQINGLNQLYKLDFEIFQYDLNDFQNCAS